MDDDDSDRPHTPTQPQQNRGLVHEKGDWWLISMVASKKFLIITSQLLCERADAKAEFTYA